MKTSAATAPDLARSVIAVPPLARFPNLELNSAANRALIRHLQEGGVTTLLYGGNANFTSGSVCIGPRGSTRLLAALKAKYWPTAEALRTAYLPLEDLRDALSPIRVLHEAVTLAGIADMGPILPPLSNIDAEHHAAIRAAAQELLAHDHALSRAPATVSPA